MKKLHPETLLNHFAENRADFKGAVVPPIFQNSLFTYPDWESIDAAFDDRVNNLIYTRGHNPSVRIVEKKLAALAGGEKAQLFPSGMAAISAVVMHCMKAGDHMVTIKNIYGPANNLFRNYLTEKMGIKITFLSGKNVDEFEKAILPETRLIYLESPSTAVFSLQDIRAIAKIAQNHGIKTAIDNSWASPIFQKPLEMGIGFEIHSCSKYIGGHSDVVAGIVIGGEEEMGELFVKEYELLGAKMAPFEAWLILRSLRTLPLRMRQHQENALAVAEFLDQHPKIKKVRYPGLADFSQAELARKQMSGFSGLMGFQLATEDLDQVKLFFNSLQWFKIGVSWGGHESLIYAPAISYLKELSPTQFKNMGIALGDMRISVGLEHKKDLINDLEQALERI